MSPNYHATLSHARSRRRHAGTWRRAGYTLIEVLTTVAVLIIVLGLMVSLARHVRERAAVALSKDVLRRLDQLMAQYQSRHDGKLPVVPLFPPRPPGPTTAPTIDAIRLAATQGPDKTSGKSTAGPTGSPALSSPAQPFSNLTPERKALLDAALANNHRFVAALKGHTGLIGGPLGDMPVSMYDEHTLRDAWGSPIVFMSAMHPAVGTAPGDRFFFFSPGPDRSYLSQEDNLYSYEEGGVGK